MFAKLFSVFLSLHMSEVCLSQTSYKDFPEECYSAKALDDESRLFQKFDTPTSQANDLDLKKGWYRVLGKAGNSLRQGYDRQLRPEKDDPPYFCGTKQPGTLMGEHPTLEEGMVEMTVCFRKPYCFFDNVKHCPCASNQTIFVRNCRGFYIYWLSPTGANQRYCTGKTSMEGPKVVGGTSQAIECKQHNIMDSDTRIWDNLADVKCDLEFKGWYRLSEVSGLEIASRCSVSSAPVSRLSQPCGATFRGWMVDRHPKVNEGRVQRRICFSIAGTCVCEFFTNIYVRNCGIFFVYRFNGVPVCNARYCGAPNNSLARVNDVSKPPVMRHDDLCRANYIVMHDPDRLWSYTSPTVTKCDAQLHGIFRFGSKYTPWSIHEGCNKTDVSIITHRCGSNLPGFMEGIHPSEKDGIVDRVICFQSPLSSPCECQYKASIQVQNCGQYYVYKINGVPACNARYCMVANKSSEITIDPGRFPLYQIPSPGHTPVPSKQQQNKGDGSSSLVATTTVLSIIVLIVIILLILVILLLIFVAWPIYKERRRGKVKSDISLEYAVAEDPRTEPKPSSSNGNLMKDEKDHKGTNRQKFPTTTLPKDPPNVPDSDSVVDMKRGPGSDDDLKTIPEDNEHSDMNDEYDTLLKKEGEVTKPTSYEASFNDSVV